MRKYLIIIALTVVLAVGGWFLYTNQHGSKNDTPKNNPTNTKKAAEKDVRQVVWEQMSIEQKERIDGDWKNGKVSKVTFNDSMGVVGDKSYQGKEVYMIDFPTKSKSIPNNMILYADVSTLDYIGNGFVD